MKTFLALYTASPTPDGELPATLSEDARARGAAAWGDWMRRHAADIIDTGGPVGRTKETSAKGVTDIRNKVTAYVIVQAESHEAAARMFEDHPHFSIFPGESVQIMERLPIPGG